MDLSQGRSIAMVHCAREVARGRADLFDPAADRRLLAIPEIGPWTMQCLGLHGRGEPDSLPAGDLAYVKLVGHLEGLGRRATVPEVEEYFARTRRFAAWPAPSPSRAGTRRWAPGRRPVSRPRAAVRW